MVEGTIGQVAKSKNQLINIQVYFGKSFSLDEA